MKKLLITGLLLFFLNGSWSAPHLFAADDEDDLFNTTDRYEKIRVIRVISVDTLQLENNERVKLIGIKALPAPERPEIQRDEYGFTIIAEESPALSIEEQSFYFMQTLLEGKDVRLEFDEQKKDEDYKTLAYVFLAKSNVFVNEQILLNGFAQLQISPPNMKYAETLRSAYLEARKEKKGVHNTD